MTTNHIYHQPCGDLIEIPDDIVDIIITSPPYNIGRKYQKGKLHNFTGYEEFSDALPQDEYERQQIDLLNSCARVLKPKGSLFYIVQPRQRDHRTITPHRWILKSQCELYQEIIWDRRSTHKMETCYVRPIHEFIYHLCKPGGIPRIDPSTSQWTSIWRINWAVNSGSLHPAMFPPELAYRCVRVAGCVPGDVLLDPYMGSGTSAIVAVEEGLRYVGYEISQRYIDMAQMRLPEAYMKASFLE